MIAVVGEAVCGWQVGRARRGGDPKSQPGGSCRCSETPVHIWFANHCQPAGTLPQPAGTLPQPAGTLPQPAESRALQGVGLEVGDGGTGGRVSLVSERLVMGAFTVLSSWLWR